MRPTFTHEHACRLLGRPPMFRGRIGKLARISLRNMQQTNYIIAMARTPDPDTEKLTRQVIFMLQPSLFAEFEGACRARYKTVSEVLREMILKFVRKNT